MTIPILSSAHSAEAIESAADRNATHSASANWLSTQTDRLVRPVGHGLDVGSRSTRCAGGTMTLTAATPSGSPELWSRYVEGAWESYSRHGVTAALDLDEVASGEIGDQIEAGMVYVNLVGADGVELPFGGVKRSGFGRELGRFGIDEFVNKKLIRIG